MLEQLKEKVLHIAKKAVDVGLVHERAGNFSAIDRQSGLVAITPSGIPREILDVDGICIVDLDGKLVEGHYKPSSETPMHTCIFKALPWVQGVVHTHSVFATSFAASGKGIPAVTNEMVRFGGEIPLAPYQIPGSLELGTTAVPFLEKHLAVLLEHHGVLTVGESLDEAFMNAVAVEDVAKIAVYSTIIGGPKPLTAEEIDGIKEYKRAAARKG